jgi:CrcB protein
MITKWLVLALFGAVGTIARAEMAAFVQRLAGPSFPWGTVAVNLLGSFAFGLVWAASATSHRSVDIRLAALTGFMGAFTTFSTFMFDTEQLIEGSRWVATSANLLIQNFAGLGCIVAGLVVGRLF